ncbi:hypothetical protein BH24ACT19_BH24ACT19_05850 [soil metagenome]
MDPLASRVWKTEVRSGGAGGFRELKERYDGYEVYDAGGGKITTDVNEANQREYVAVSGDLSGLIPDSKPNLVPMDLCTVDNKQRAIRVSTDAESV